MSISVEAQVLGRYLLGKPIDARSAALYEQALRSRSVVPCGVRDQNILEFALAHPWAIGCLDAALALFGPRGAALRRKLLVMTAVLEVRPEYSDLYLTQSDLPAPLLSLPVIVVKEAVKAAGGWLLLRVVLR